VDKEARKFHNSSRQLFDEEEWKWHRETKYRPDQPRRPKGTPIGGQWMENLQHFGPDSKRIGQDMADSAERLDAFIEKHQSEIVRLVGGFQLVGGTLEVVAGTAIGTGGVATSEVVIGLPIAAAGAWLVWNGYDNAQAGWHALVTGEPKPTSLHKLLRDFGLRETTANNVELILGVAGGAAGARLGEAAFEAAARRELARRALRAFDRTTALSVGTPSGSIWKEKDIRSRGDIWEGFDASRTGYIRTPNAAVFDQISPNGTVAISNKTLDLQAETYLRSDRRALYSTAKRYIDRAAAYTPLDPRTKVPLPYARREVRLLLRFGDSVPGQALQLAAADEYAKSVNVKLLVEYAF